MSGSGKETNAIVVIIVVASLLAIIIFVICMFSYTRWLKKKRKEFVENTSQKIKELKAINKKYYGMFGCLEPCDINVTAPFKYKRTFEHFCDDDNKIEKFVLDYQDEILKRMILVVKNISTNPLYIHEIKNIKATKLDTIKLDYGLTEEKYLVLEQELFEKAIYHAPEAFSFKIKATYSSEKGYSNYYRDINCNDGWLQECFLKRKHIDLVMIAHKSVMSDRSIFVSKPKEKVISQNVYIEPIESGEYNGDIPYSDLLNMSYREIVSYLLAKYGVVKGDYFCTETCKSKNKKISRTKEGLFIHHIDEDKAIMLSTDKFAVNNPFRYQKADRLVYCNILEHLLLHVKIAEEPRNNNANKDELPGIGGAVNFICRQINDCYSDYEFEQPMMIYIREMIKDMFDDYILILQRLLDIVRADSVFSTMITKEQLSCGFYGNIVKRVYKALK